MNEILFSLNGRLVPESAAVVPVTDRGFLYGDGLFETLHVYGRTVFRLEQHLERLEHGMRVLAFRPRPARAVLARWVKAAVAAGGFPEANVRLTVTRGTGLRGPAIRGHYRPSVVIMVSRFRRRPETDYTRGVAAIVASFRRQEASILASLKTTAYLEQIIARREADAAGVDEAILLNNAGLLCEGSASNINLIHDGMLRVPEPRLSGALPGTAQQVAVELAEQIGIPVSHTALGLFDLRECDEAFLSGSLRELTPLVRVNGKAVGTGKPGPVTRRLITAYRAFVERVCRPYRFPR
jgi:branched-subunit amino acid aminotransferase/4-amino-4-deoxychorismate lyase